MAFDEQQFIAWVTGEAGEEADRSGLREQRLAVGPGDDGAVLIDGTVVALDSFVEGVHFDPGTPAELLARKALGACLSDLCAMGAEAEAVFLSAQLSPGCDGEALAAALVRWSRAFGVALAGGDTVRTSPGSLALSVTAIGRCGQGHAPWLRSGGQVGDQLVVSGPLGGSRSGRHLRVKPRQDLVRRAREESLPVHACMDLSDGLGTDLPRLCKASGLGAVIIADRLPIHPDVDRQRDTTLAALGDGEDFELLFALPPSVALPAGCTKVGSLRQQSLIELESAGKRQPWPEAGHVHRF